MFYAVLWLLVIFITCCLMCCIANVAENILEPDSGTHIHKQPLSALPLVTLPWYLFKLHALSLTCKSYVQVCVECDGLSMDWSATSCKLL